MSTNRPPGRLPEFIIGGAPRSGTTWLYHLLDRHPSIYMAKPVRPEPKFFLIGGLYERGLEFYSEEWFDGVPRDVVAGEKSTNYLESEEAAKRIHHDLPGVKLIFVLREPVSRAVSNWRWSLMNGLETLSLQDALQLESEREASYTDQQVFSRPFSYFSRGLYFNMLQPYVDLFGPEQVLCLRYEDIRRDPESLAQSAHHFLGVPARVGDAIDLGAINPSKKDGVEVDPDTLENLRRRYEQPNRRLSELLGPAFTMWGSNDA